MAAKVFIGSAAGFAGDRSDAPVILGGYASGATASRQYAPSALSINVGGRMPAMRNRKSFDG